jgi:hypothetical protein
MPYRIRPLDRSRAPAADIGRACFADEAAIDFPSVDAAIGRMRDSFLGHEERCVQAMIALSSADAARGREVVVTLPVRRTCGACGGRGEIWNDACPTCLGCGDELDAHDVHVSVPAGVRHGTRMKLTINATHAAVTHLELRIEVRL